MRAETAFATAAQRLQSTRNKNRDQTHRRAASKGRRGTLAVLEYERGAILSLRLSKVGRLNGNSQSFPVDLEVEKIGGPWGVVVARAYRSLALTIAGGSGLLSHPIRNPDLDLLPHKNPQFCSPQQPPTSTYRSTPTHPANRQDGSPRRSPCWYEIRLLSGFPGEGYDQALDLPPAVQVRRLDSRRRKCRKELLNGSRVGDIVDIKVNGAVQKG
jgi:hypothetical protein